jgi:hypothetical protein
MTGSVVQFPVFGLRKGNRMARIYHKKAARHTHIENGKDDLSYLLKMENL